jgi:hypothetical protein
LEAVEGNALNRTSQRCKPDLSGLFGLILDEVVPRSRLVHGRKGAVFTSSV